MYRTAQRENKSHDLSERYQVIEPADFRFQRKAEAQTLRISAHNPRVTNSIKRERMEETEGLKLPSVLLKEEIVLPRALSSAK